MSNRPKSGSAGSCCRDNYEKEVESSDDVKSSCSFSSIKCVLILIFSIILPILFAGYVSFNINNLKKLEPVKYSNIIADAPSYKWFKIENFFQNGTVSLLADMFLNGDVLSTVVEDHNVESAGEAVEIGHVILKF